MFFLRLEEKLDGERRKSQQVDSMKTLFPLLFELEKLLNKLGFNFTISVEDAKQFITAPVLPQSPASKSHALAKFNKGKS